MDCPRTDIARRSGPIHKAYAERVGLDPVLFAGTLGPLGVSDRRRQA
jgi:hypothetical protein